MSNRRQVAAAGDISPLFPMDEATWAAVTDALALSPQQNRIVELILCGKQDREIAAALGLSFPTVRTYLGRIFDRLKVDDRMGLVLHVFALAQNMPLTRRRHK
jgi:DNA-binding NarL/FixJ family response regulator